MVAKDGMKTTTTLPRRNGAKRASYRTVQFLWKISFGVSLFLGSFLIEGFAPNLLHHTALQESRTLQGRIRDFRSLEPKSKTAVFVFPRLEETLDTKKRRSNVTMPVDNTRGYCPRCKRPNVVCICDSLPATPIDCGTRILILQHPREAKKRKRTSTVPLIGLSVKNVEICVGTKFGPGTHPLLDKALNMAKDKNSKYHSLLLYPSEESSPLQDYLEAFSHTLSVPNSTSCAVPFASTTSDCHILVVLDGTWAQTQTMVQNSYDTLRELPFVMFDESTDSVFDSLRQEPAPHCTSTLEAVSRAIRLLGAPGAYHRSLREESDEAADALEASLQAMVDGQLQFALDRNTAKPRYYRKNMSNQDANEDGKEPISKRAQGRNRKLVSKRRRAVLSLPKPKTKEEIEMDRIRFIYIAHMG